MISRFDDFILIEINGVVSLIESRIPKSVLRILIFLSVRVNFGFVAP
ncbi:hypothetical protein D083_0930 [Dickeya solani RNS 08.23.3.1.A]|nr:hypothetical protein D083_0930 [Dickeya solani RNS 08.23.3.1.A]